jgi:hypothetical protein
MLRMPPEADLPAGPLREFVEELFVHYRAADRPTLREIAQWINDHAESHDLRGTASTETIRRVLKGSVVPRSWHTVSTIVQAFCGMAGRSIDEERWPPDRWNDGESITFIEEVKRRWNAALDHYETVMPELPAPARASATPAPREPDPWETPAAVSRLADDEPPF